MGIQFIGLLCSTLFGVGPFKPGKRRNRDNSELSDDWLNGPPQFTRKDEQNAREEGFFDALDRWRWIVGGKQADLGREKIKRMTKAQTAADLESEGVPFDELGEMSDEAIHLPLHPDYTAEHQIHVPKNEYERDAHIMGMCNRLIQIKERLAKYGLSLEMTPDEVPAKHRDVYQWAQHEYATLAERLAAFGEDIDDIERDIDSGEILRQDFVDSPSDEEIVADQSRRSTSAVNTHGQSQKYDDTGRATDSGGSGPGGQGKSSQSSPRVHLKEHEIAMMREQLGQISDQMRDLGYDWETALADVSAQDRGLVRQLIRERDTIARDLAGLCEDIDEVEREMREEKVADESDDMRESASDSSDEGGNDEANDDAGFEEGQEEASGDAGQGTDADSWSGSADGWEGMFD